MWLPMPRYPSRTALAIRAAHAHAAHMPQYWDPWDPQKCFGLFVVALTWKTQPPHLSPLQRCEVVAVLLPIRPNRLLVLPYGLPPAPYCPWQKEGWGGVSLWTRLGLGLGLGLG